MKRLRLVLVTRRFWPLVGGAATVFGELACELSRREMQVTIVTARWKKSWPARMVWRELPVHRLPHPGSGAWGRLRYMSHLSRWLKQHRGEIDLLLVSGLGADAYSAVGAMRQTEIPVVLRSEEAGPGGDCHWQMTAQFGGRVRRRCQAADLFIATCAAGARELEQASYRRDRIREIANGVSLPPRNEAKRRTAARESLAEAHNILAVSPNTPLVVYAGRFDRDLELCALIEAWPEVLARWPKARLWLIGDGRRGREIWERIGELNLNQQVIMPGTFDHLDDVLGAADVFVQPCSGEDVSVETLTAMAAGLPVVVADSPALRTVVEHGQSGLLVPPNDAAAFAQAIQRVLAKPELAEHLGTAARRLVQQRFSAARMADAHLEVFEEVMARKTRD